MVVWKEAEALLMGAAFTVGGRQDGGMNEGGRQRCIMACLEAKEFLAHRDAGLSLGWFTDISIDRDRLGTGIPLGLFRTTCDRYRCHWRCDRKIILLDL